MTRQLLIQVVFVQRIFDLVYNVQSWFFLGGDALLRGSQIGRWFVWDFSQLEQCPEWDAGSTLVFVNHKQEAQSLGHFLKQHGVSANSIHGDKTQEEREQALWAFKSGAFASQASKASLLLWLLKSSYTHKSHGVNYKILDIIF